MQNYFWTFGTRLLILSLLLIALFANIRCVPEFKSDDPPWSTCYTATGEHPCDFTLLNQNGDEVSLYDYYGKVIILDFSAMWCGPCQAAARSIDDTVKKFGADEIVYITILIENTQRLPPTIEDLELWASGNNIELGPVLGADRSFLENNGWQLEAWPTFYFIDREMILRGHLRGYSEAAVDDAIDMLVSE